MRAVRSRSMTLNAWTAGDSVGFTDVRGTGTHPVLSYLSHLSLIMLSWVQSRVFAPTTAHYKLFHRLRGLLGPANAVEISPDGTFLASAGESIGSIICLFSNSSLDEGSKGTQLWSLQTSDGEVRC